MAGHVVAMGGWHPLLLDHALGVARVPRPRVLHVPTAVADDPARILAFREDVERRGLEADHLRLFGVPDDPPGRVARADVVVVNGGNTANMLAVWRVHGVDDALRRAWQDGAVLCGWSAGANCWFERSVTDSFAADLRPLEDGLGLLAGSFCPHYDGEPRRRPVYERLVAEGALPSGLACDDAAAVVFRGTEPVEAVGAVPGARAWRVGPDGSSALPTRLLP